MAVGDPGLRPAAVPADRGVGRQVPLRADRRASDAADSWVYDLMRRGAAAAAALGRSRLDRRGHLPRMPLGSARRRGRAPAAGRRRDRTSSGLLVVLAAVGCALWLIVRFVARRAQPADDAARAFGLGLLTLIRVVVLIALASADLGADRRLDRAAAGAGRSACSRWRSSWRPSRPICCSRSSSCVIVRFSLNPDIWLSPLMVLGTQWYILFNVIAGASGVSRPTCARRRRNFRMRGWQWWRKVMLPGHPAVLRHRRDHRLGRLVERQHRRRGGELGRYQADSAGLGAYIAAGDRSAATIRASCWASPSCRCFVAAVQSPAVAAALRLCRTPPAPGLSEEPRMDTDVAPAVAARGQRAAARPITRTASADLVVLDDVNLTPARGRDRGAARPLGLRQIDAAAHHRRPAARRPRARCSGAAGRCTGRPRASPWCSRASRCFPG